MDTNKHVHRNYTKLHLTTKAAPKTTKSHTAMLTCTSICTFAIAARYHCRFLSFFLPYPRFAFPSPFVPSNLFRLDALVGFILQTKAPIDSTRDRRTVRTVTTHRVQMDFLRSHELYVWIWIRFLASSTAANGKRLWPQVLILTGALILSLRANGFKFALGQGTSSSFKFQRRTGTAMKKRSAETSVKTPPVLKKRRHSVQYEWNKMMKSTVKFTYFAE